MSQVTSLISSIFYPGAFLREQSWGLCCSFFYINDLPNFLSHSQPHLYEDGTHLTFASDKIYYIGVYLNQDLIH